MDRSVAELFVILALNPDKGRISINHIHFRYSMTGALIMDFLEKGEIKIENKRVVPSILKNGNYLHDMYAEIIMKPTKNRRISYWIKRLSYKSRIAFREIINSLTTDRIIRKEQKKFLNLFPYYKYWLIDSSIRNNVIEVLRGILLYGKRPDKKEIMLLGLVDACKGYHLLARENGEAKIMRKKNHEILKGDSVSEAIDQTIREVQIAIIASITAASIGAHGSH